MGEYEKGRGAGLKYGSVRVLIRADFVLRT